jgi:predicted nucleotidyltransferase
MRKLRRPEPETEARWLAEVRRIATRILAPHPVDVYLIGSRARGDARLASDIDVAIDPREELPQRVLAELEEAYEESTVPVRVEVVDLSRASPRFRARALEEGVKWIGSKSA